MGTYVVLGRDIVDISLGGMNRAIFNDSLQGRLAPVDHLGRAINSPPEEILGRSILDVIDRELVLSNNRRRNRIRHKRNEVSASLIVTSRSHSNTGRGRIRVRSSVVVQDSTDLNASTENPILCCAIALCDAHPVVACSLICVDDNVVALACQIVRFGPADNLYFIVHVRHA